MPETNDHENIIIQKSMGFSKSSSQREVHSYTGLLPETNKIKQPNTPPKELEKEQTNPKSSRRKEIKIRGKIEI